MGHLPSLLSSLVFTSFILLKKYLSLQIKRSKTCCRFKRKRHVVIEGDTEQPLYQSQCRVTFHPEWLLSSLTTPPFLPLACVLLAKSHILSLPLPAQTPFGGPSFPAVALGITCYTHICKTNQVWKGHRVPALQRWQPPQLQVPLC